MLALLLALSASAWEFEVQPSFALDEEGAAVAAVHRGGRDLIAMATGDEVLLVDVMVPEVVETVEVAGVRAVLGADLDGNGEEDLLLCTDEALLSVSWGAEPAEAVGILDEGCAALALHQVYGADGLAAHAASGTWIWEDLGIAEPLLAHETAMDDPLLAGAGTLVGVAERDGWSIVRVSAGGVEVATTDGSVSGLTGLDGTLAWSLGQEAQVVVGAVALETDAHPGAVAAADLDGDGDHHLVVGFPTAVGLFAAGEQVQTLTTGREARSILAADLDGDGCDDLVVVDEQLVTPFAQTGCEAEPVDTGDTGAPEPQGCGGPARMRLGVAGAVDGVADEGDAVTVAARPAGCVPDGAEVRWEYQGGDIALCQPDGWSLDCALLDDGDLEVRASLWTARGAFLDDGTESLEVENLDPVLVSHGEWIFWEILEGVPLTAQLEAEDVPADTVTWELDGYAPDGLEVSPEGVVSWPEPEVGGWELSLSASDEDGGTLYVNAELYVNEDLEANRRAGIWRIVGLCLTLVGAALAMILVVLLGRPASMV